MKITTIEQLILDTIPDKGIKNIELVRNVTHDYFNQYGTPIHMSQVVIHCMALTSRNLIKIDWETDIITKVN